MSVRVCVCVCRERWLNTETCMSTMLKKTSACKSAGACTEMSMSAREYGNAWTKRCAATYTDVERSRLKSIAEQQGSIWRIDAGGGRKPPYTAD